MADICPIVASPVRIIPFDLGRSLTDEDIAAIKEYAAVHCKELCLSPRQESVLKGVATVFQINEILSGYAYNNGICVIVVNDTPLRFQDHIEHFSIYYGENRKQAHSDFFKWEHAASNDIWRIIEDLRKIIKTDSPRGLRLRRSADISFENKGLSYIMTLSFFDIEKNIIHAATFRNYPNWLKSNIYALLDPAVLYLEDSSKFESSTEIDFDLGRILQELEINNDIVDYERHKHVNTFMSWDAVIVCGQIQKADKEEYTALEIQLQCDWFYVYCLDKCLDDYAMSNKKELIEIQGQNYEVDLLVNRLYDFDDSSMPARILDIQKGLVTTSGLDGNIQHLQRKIQYFLEREQLNSTLKQKRVSQSTEILLFIIAYIEIAPTVVEYGNRIFPHAGMIVNAVLVLIGVILLLRKD